MPIELEPRPGLLACVALAALCAPIAGLHAEPAAIVHFSGPVFSASGQPLPALATFADCTGRARIPGLVKDGSYQLDLPAGASCTVIVGERDWESQPQPVFDAARALALPVLVYPREVPEPALARELIAMGEQDLALRHATAANPDSPSDRRGLVEDAARLRRLEDIIGAKGWPTISMVGFEAANAAWLIAQHTPRDQLSRAKFRLALMQAAAARHEIFPANLAASIDRVLVYEDQPQRYGTQFRTGAAGMAQPYPIADMAHLDQRRRAMGLPPFAENLRLMNQGATTPADR